MMGLLAVIVMTVGVIFAVLAAAGVLRFKDPLQRMHAATKAGTVGASLCLAGAALAMGQVDATIVALLSILFMIATMPVAGHLLGRAAYISGAPLRTGRDALKGVLPRAKSPLDERSRAASARAAEAASGPASRPPAGGAKKKSGGGRKR